MLEFITDNYFIIMIVSLFLIFALIGYIIDSSINKKKGDEPDEIIEVTTDIPETAPAIEVNIVSEEEVEEAPSAQDEDMAEESAQADAVNQIPEIEEPEDNN